MKEIRGVPTVVHPVIVSSASRIQMAIHSRSCMIQYAHDMQNELIGRACADFFHPDEAKALAGDIAETVSAACSIVPAEASTFESASPMKISGCIDLVSDRGCFEYRLRTKNVTAEGDPLYAYVETRCIVFRTLHPDGTPNEAALILCLTRNITEKKLRELRDVTHEAKTWAAVARRTLIRYCTYHHHAYDHNCASWYVYGRRPLQCTMNCELQHRISGWQWMSCGPRWRPPC
jgi:hypothetical protein